VSSHYETFEDDGGKWRWRLQAGNNEIVATSEAYESKEGAQRGIDDHKTAAATADEGDPGTAPAS